jgi:uncharacterized protein
MLEEALLIATALIAGLLVGLTGVGGGAIMTPTLILLFGIPTIVAIATDLVFATVTKLVSTLIHSKKRSVNWDAAKTIWCGSIPGTVFGVAVLIAIGSQFNFLLSILLALVLLFTSFSMLRSKGFGLKKQLSDRSASLGGAGIGFAVATTSVGAGALGMALLRAKLGDASPRLLVGTDIVHAIPIALIAGSSYAFAGFLDFRLLLVLLVGSIPGVILGSLLTDKINASSLRKVLAIILGVAAVGVVLKLL